MLQHEFKVKLVTCPYPTISEFGHGLHFWGLNLQLYQMFICTLRSGLYEYFILFVPAKLMLDLALYVWEIFQLGPS